MLLTSRRKQIAMRALSVGLAALLCACGSPKIRISSAPADASVVIILPNGEESPLGKTPFESDSDKIAEACRHEGMNGTCRLGVVKKGYVRESLLVSRSALTDELDARVKLFASSDWLDQEKNDAFLGKLGEVAHLTARIQGQTIRGHYDAALETARQLVGRYPSVAVGWDLLGNIYYLKKRPTQALDAYQKSLAIDSNNVDTRNIVAALRGGGTRVPAAFKKGVR